MGFSLPNAGDVQGQVAAGNKLINQIQTASSDPAAAAGLLEAGISLAGNAIGGEGGQVMADVFGGFGSGLAMAGPVGAVVGAIVGFAEAVASLFAGNQGVENTLGVSMATQTITSYVTAAGGQHPDILTGQPQGWASADWSAFARPPSSTQIPQRLMKLMQAVARYALGAGGGALFQNSDNVPSNIARVLGRNQAGSPGGPVPLPQEFANGQKPLCTPVFFKWYQWQSIIDCDKFLTFGPGGAGGSVSQLKDKWTKSVYAQKGLTQEEIVNRAIQRLPDPSYWSFALYGTTVPGGFGSWGTVYYNPDLLNAMAAVLMMLSSGASTKAIVSELLMHAAILDAHGNVDPSGNPMPGLISDNRAGFNSLLDDYITLAAIEDGTDPMAAQFAQLAAAVAGAPMSTGGKVGAVVAGVAGLGAVGLLGYSAYKKTSPLDVMKQIKGKVRSRL